MAVAVSSETSDRKRTLILEQFVPYRIVALGHALSGDLASAYANENLTIPEWRVLAVVAQAEELAARDVVGRTPMDKMTVSRASASLEAKGFVIRQTSQNDRRLNMLSLSKTGRQLFERVAALALDYENGLMSALSVKERAVFESALSKLTDFTDAGNVGVSDDDA